MPPFHFKSCVFNPMLAKGKISFSSPSVVWPSMTTWECKLAMVAQRDVFANDAIGSDVAIGADLRLGMDDGCGNHGIHWPSNNMKVTSASLTDFAVDLADAFGLADFAARFGQFHFNDQHVAGRTGLRQRTLSADMK